MSALRLALRTTWDHLDGPNGRWIVLAVMAVFAVVVFALDVRARRGSR